MYAHAFIFDDELLKFVPSASQVESSEKKKKKKRKHAEEFAEETAMPVDSEGLLQGISC